MIEYDTFLYTCENNLAFILDQKKRASHVCAKNFTNSPQEEQPNNPLYIQNNLSQKKCIIELYTTYEQANTFKKNIYKFISILDLKIKNNRNEVSINILRKQKKMAFLLIKMIINIEKETIQDLNYIQSVYNFKNVNV